MKRVSGKIALVTGAASGIGQATARLLAHEGATVFCADLDPQGSRRTADAIVAEGGSASGLALDVTSEEAWLAALEAVVAGHGRLDVLVGSAGISHACPLPDMPLADWRRVLAVNLDGIFLGTRHGIRVMREHGGGSIVNVSSVSGIRASPGAAAYCVSKAAVCMLGRAAAKECVENRWPVRVNTVCPGGVKTPLWSTMPFFRELVEKTGSEEEAFRAVAGPAGRFAEAAEIAAAILFLASDEAGYVTGADLVIDNAGSV